MFMNLWLVLNKESKINSAKDKIHCVQGSIPLLNKEGIFQRHEE
jgi:hypothetical protein